MSKIIRLSSTNYKRLKAVTIEPDANGNLVIVAGRNGQGKSSVLDSITAALGGVSSKTTPKPIRDGEDSAEIVLETEDLIVTRKFTASGSTLKVTSPDGATYNKGQARLDDLLGKLSLDPLAFTQLSDRDQLATLLGLVDLDFDPEALDTARKAVFEQRTDVNRKVKELGAQVKGYAVTEPVEEVSVSDLLTLYSGAVANNESYSRAHTAAQTATERVEQLRAELEEAEAAKKRADAAYASHPKPVDQTAIQAQIDGAEQTNARAREYADYQWAKDQHDAAQANAGKLSADLEAIDKRKADGLAKAKFPIDGLGFDEGGVTYQGIPFKQQASSAEQLRVSTAMAIALNPTLRVIRITDGSLLDADNLALIDSMAKEHDFQVWIEIVGDGDGTGVIIEDGEVA